MIIVEEQKIIRILQNNTHTHTKKTRLLQLTELKKKWKDYVLFLFYFICKVLENERNRKKKSYVHFNQKNTKKKLSVSLWITSAS